MGKLREINDGKMQIYFDGEKRRVCRAIRAIMIVMKWAKSETITMTRCTNFGKKRRKKKKRKKERKKKASVSGDNSNNDSNEMGKIRDDNNNRMHKLWGNKRRMWHYQ